MEIESQYPLVKIETIITKLINGSTPSKTEDSYWNSNDINWLTTPDFSDEKIYISNTSQFVSKKAFDDKKVSIIPINSVVLTCTATIGKVGVTKIELTTNQQINSLICDISKVIPEFLAYFLKTQKENLENLTSNSGVKHINMGMCPVSPRYGCLVS
jgi:restriction endonuclease S subunit